MKCGVEKNSTQFHKDSSRKDGLADACKECVKARVKTWRLANPEKHREHVRASAKGKPQSDKWRKANPEKMRAARRANKTKRLADPAKALYDRISNQIRSALDRKSGKTLDLVGYSAVELMTQIERQFLPGMSWANKGKWHIDHIVPVSSFPESDKLKAWDLTNLRPLWAKDNLRKYTKREFLL